MAFFGIFLIMVTVMLIMLVLLIIELIGKWQVYRKMGLTPWKCLIPFYSTYLEFGKVWESKYFAAWLVLYIIYLVTPGFFDRGIGLFLRLFVLVITIALMAVNFILCLKFSYAFHAGIGMAFGLFFLPFIFFPVLGFSRVYTYGGPAPTVTVE